jgi:hypothetical protein
MREQLEKILSYSIGEIVSSPLVLELLSIYSTLYLKGDPPGYCESCIKNYYSELKKNGMEKLNKYEEAKKRTLIPKWSGLKYIHKGGKHYDSLWITDKEAIELLKSGILRESHFEKLPEGYLKKNTTDAKSEKTTETKKRTRKPKTEQ